MEAARIRLSGSIAAWALAAALVLVLTACRRESPPSERAQPPSERAQPEPSASAAIDSGPRRSREPAAELDTTGLSVAGADTIPPKTSEADSLLGLAAAAPSRGPAGAAVTIVEFSDFECPFCKRVHATLGQLLENRPDVRLVYMQYPILSLHPGAMLPAEASVEAQRQGKFWPFHDALFRHGPPLDRPTVLRLAKQAGLDTAALERALDTRAHRDRVEREIRIGEDLGINGTPTFFINGYRLVGSQPYEVFVTYYNLLLRASRRELAESRPPS